MANSITIQFLNNDTDIQIPVTYTMESTGNMHTIVCSVVNKTNPQWLQIRKFDLMSVKEKNVYVPMFNEKNNEKNQATSLFIDKAYIDIMKAEKLAVKSYAADTV